MPSNSTGFTYSVNAPLTGPIVKFSTGGGYDLQINAPYYWGNEMYFRVRNGDLGVWRGWKQLLNAESHSYAANMNQYVRTTDDVTHNAITTSTRFTAPGLTIGYWDGTYNRIESATRDLFITSYTNTIKFGNSGGVDMTFGSTRNLFITNPETYSGEVRLGAAWGRGGLYTSNTLTLGTSSGVVDMVYSDSTRFRYQYDGTYGARLMLNTTSMPYTLVDTNARPALYMRGQYPVLTLDHTVTSNTGHGPTIQFVFDGYDQRQWVIGCPGNGSALDFGYSSSGYSNSNYNPHNGISGYQGNTIMRIIDGAVGIGNDWGIHGGGNPGYTLDVRGTTHTTSFRLSGTMVLSGSGAEIGNSTGARLSESYGPIWNLTNSSTWHHQVINGSYLCGISAGGGNYGGGNYYGTGDVTAYYSDERLKTKVSSIQNALDKVKSLEGFIYVENELARSFGYTNENEQAGLSAQSVQAVLPQAVSLAPFDMQGVPETGEIISKSGDNYLTVKYERLVPLLVEAIKELKAEIDELKSQK
jgi:hypothetical protein